MHTLLQPSPLAQDKHDSEVRHVANCSCHGLSSINTLLYTEYSSCQQADEAMVHIVLNDTADI